MTLKKKKKAQLSCSFWEEAIINLTSEAQKENSDFFLYAHREGIIAKNLFKHGTDDNISILWLLWNSSCMKIILLQLPFVYEEPLSSTANFLLWRLILLACKLSGMLAKLCAAELCVLTFGFLCCVFSGVKDDSAWKAEFGLKRFELIKSNSQCLAECIILLIRKLMFTYWKNLWVNYGNNQIVLVN